MKRNAKHIPIANRAFMDICRLYLGICRLYLGICELCLGICRLFWFRPDWPRLFKTTAGPAGLPTYSPDYSPDWPVGNTGQAIAYETKSDRHLCSTRTLYSNLNLAASCYDTYCTMQPAGRRVRTNNIR